VEEPYFLDRFAAVFSNVRHIRRLRAYWRILYEPS
jgi:hypothetical protein